MSSWASSRPISPARSDRSWNAATHAVRARDKRPPPGQVLSGHAPRRGDVARPPPLAPPDRGPRAAAGGVGFRGGAPAAPRHPPGGGGGGLRGRKKGHPLPPAA